MTDTNKKTYPASGGSYKRDPDSGKLNQARKPAADRAPEKAATKSKPSKAADKSSTGSKS